MLQEDLYFEGSGTPLDLDDDSGNAWDGDGNLPWQMQWDRYIRGYAADELRKTHPPFDEFLEELAGKIPTIEK